MSSTAAEIRRLKAALKAEEEKSQMLELVKLKLELDQKRHENEKMEYDLEEGAKQLRKSKMNFGFKKSVAEHKAKQPPPPPPEQKEEEIEEQKAPEQLTLTDRKEQTTEKMKVVRVSVNHFSLSDDHIPEMVAAAMKETSEKTLKMRLIFESDRNTSHRADATLVGANKISADKLKEELNKLLMNSLASDSSGTWQWMELEVVSKI